MHTHVYSRSGGNMPKGHRSLWKISQRPKLEQFEQQSKVLLDHIPEYKTSIYEFPLI